MNYIKIRNLVIILYIYINFNIEIFKLIIQNIKIFIFNLKNNFFRYII